MQPANRTYAEINISNILSNIRALKEVISKNVKFMAVVKADAYGHGAMKLAGAISSKIDYLSVATVSEALELRNAGVKAPILILSEISVSDAKEVVSNGLIQTVYTDKLSKALSAAAEKTGRKARVHLKIDTGMGRIGVSVNDAVSMYERISALPGVKVEGIFTHFAKAEEKNGFTLKQLEKFRSVTQRIGSKNLICHTANSAATLYNNKSHLDMVRIGLSMYGLYPPAGKKTAVCLRPALEFKTRVVYLKTVPAGTPISYGATYITDRKTKIATLPVGYADGLPRALSNKGEVIIRGKRYPIVGRICMDLTMVNVGNDDINVDDEVVMIGKQGGQSISCDEVAKLADTISYEIICGIGKRVPRIYIK